MPQEVIPDIQSLETVTERFNTLNSLIWEHVTTQSDTQMSQIEGQIASAHQKLTESLTAYESVMSSQPDMDLYQSDKEALSQFDALGSEVLTLSLSNEKKDGHVANYCKNKATIQQVISALQKHREYNFTKAHGIAENVFAIKAAATTTSIITMIIAALIVVAISLFITRTLTKALGDQS